MIDTDGDCTPDTTFKAVLYEIKSIANNPNSSTADLERAKALTEAVADHANGYPNCPHQHTGDHHGGGNWYWGGW